MSSANIYVNSGKKPRTQHPGKWWVRIKPYSPGTGATVRRMKLRKLGSIGAYKESEGWYVRKISREQVKLLLGTHVNPHDNSTPSVFDVCTFEEAHALDVQVKVKVKAAGGRRDAADAIESSSFSTRDLPRRTLPSLASAEVDDRQTMDARREEQAPPDEDFDDDVDFEDEDG